VHEVIEMTGLESVADKRVAGFSLGMGQRLGIASAMLGDPRTLILDEPVNGLDPEGVKWVRTMVRRLAAEGRTVFISSHLMSEMSQTADHLLVIGRGRIIASGPIQEIIEAAEKPTVLVRSPSSTRLAELLDRRGATVSVLAPEELEVHDVTSAVIGETAASAGITLHELTPIRASLEDAYLSLTRDEVEYRSHRAPEGADR
jgi:ABC-2 type transport system ATP-binding protein